MLALVPPGEHEVLVFLVGLVAILAVARVLGWLLGRIGQPAVVGELLAGILLGPSILGKVAPDVFAWMFPDDEVQGGMLYGVAWLGLLLLLAATGFESDLGVLRRLGRPAILVSAGSLVVPLVAGFAFGLVVPASLLGDEVDQATFAAFLAVALSISSLPVVARVLSDLGLMRRNVGQLILAAALSNDVIGWVLLGVVAGLAAGGVDAADLALTVGGLALFLVGAFTIGRRVVDAALRAVATTETDTAGPAVVIVGLVLGAGALTQWMGVEAVLGAFVGGMVVGRSRWRDERVLRLVETIAHRLLAPVFFATAGLRVDLGVFADPEVALWSVLIVLVASVTKFAGSMAGARLGGLPRREGLALGVGLNARGALEIVMATVGLSLGVLNEESYGAIVVMAIVTSVAAPPLLRIILRDWTGTEEERVRLEQEAQERDRVLISERPPLLASRGGPASIVAAQVLDLSWPRDIPVHIVSAGPTDPDLTPVRNVFWDRAVSHLHRTDQAIEEVLLAEARRGHGAIVLGIPGTPADPLRGSAGLVDRVLAEAQVPVVLVRGERITGRALPAAFARAVVPVTGTVNSRAVQELAFALAGSLGTELVLTHLDAGPDLPYGGSAVTQPLAMAEPLLRQAAEAARGGGGGSVRTIARRADGVAPELVRIALETESDLLLVGATRRDLDGVSFLGPVAAHVLDLCPTTVVVVVTPPGWRGWKAR